MLLSSFIFTAASFAAIFADNIYMLIFCRFFQGIGTAGLSVVLRAAAVDCFSGFELKKALNNFSISWSLGPIIGPFIGGYFQHYFNWQTDFYFFGLYGLIIALLITYTLPETHFNLQKLRLREILAQVKIIITNKIFLFTAIIGSLVYAFLVVFNMIGPFLIQRTLHYSTVAYGYMALLLGIAYFLGNITNRIMINYFQPMHIALTATIFSLATTIAMLSYSLFFTMNIYSVLTPIWFFFFLCGLILPNMMGKAFALFPHLAGSTSAVYGFIGIAGVFAISLLTTLLKTNNTTPLALLYVTALILILPMALWLKS